MKYGEIIELGKHRLMCGDATSREDVMKLIGNDKVNLVLTDPPYGMKAQDRDGCIGDGTRTTLVKSHNNYHIARARQYPQMIGDTTNQSAKKHYEITRGITQKQIIWGGQYFAEFLPVSGGWIFWDKENGTSDFSDGELAYRSWGKKLTKYSQKWCGYIVSGNAKLNGLGGRKKHDTKSRYHPTQKPVELHMRILEDFSQSDDVILDCFGGSGTTLIACEMTGRKCLMMEFSPEYCDVISERYMKLKEDYPLNY